MQGFKSPSLLIHFVGTNAQEQPATLSSHLILLLRGLFEKLNPKHVTSHHKKSRFAVLPKLEVLPQPSVEFLVELKHLVSL